MNSFTTIEEINLEGFQIVKSEMFSHLPRKSGASCTIGPTKISFSHAALTMLNNCEFIRLEVNPTTKCILVVPVPSSDKQRIRWIKGQKDFVIRSMESKAFGTELYRSWKLDSNFNYRVGGKLVSANKKIMLLFDFSEPEQWPVKKGEGTPT